MRIIVIGGVAAGAKAAAKARRVAPDSEVVIYQDEQEVSYSACGLPYVISGIIKDEKSVVIRRPEDFAKDDIQVFSRHRVTQIDTEKRQLAVTNLDQGHNFLTTYDKLIVATGAIPIVPNVEGISLEGVLVLRTMQDFNRFKSVLATLHPKKAVIIGAGYIGLELAETFHELNIHTTIVEKAGRILPKFDPEMAQLVHDHLTGNQVKLVLGDGLAKIIGANGRAVAVMTESGQQLPTDIVVIAIGIRPNAELAKQAGITLGATGAIAVDSRMATNVPDIYAAGDCCETVHRLTGTAVWLPLGDIANLQGRIAGENAAGGNNFFPGVLGTAIFKTFALAVATTGLSEQAAKQFGFDPIVIVTKGGDRARYYPGKQDFTLKLVANREDGRLLGAQVIGYNSVDKMVDIIATALLGHLTCADLENADFAYSPPFSPTISPVILAASILKKIGHPSFPTKSSEQFRAK